MSQTTEPRALSAALSGPAMTTRAGGLAMHVADRHVERWAPEATAHQSRPLRNLGFVDRTIAPWLQTAQRSASLRLFAQYRSEGLGERQGGHVSWVFPRPWYQDELDWMAAAREAPMHARTDAMLTTRGTYVAGAQSRAPAALPASLYEYIAPSLSVAQPTTDAHGIGHGGSEAYSPLVPLAAVQAAEVMQRAVAPALAASARPQPSVRNVLATMLERAMLAREVTPSRVSMQAPALVTPPAPRADDATPQPQAEPSEAMQLAERYAEQRAQIAEVQRVARVAAQRELAARIEAARAQVEAQTTASSTQATPAVRDATARAEAVLRERAAETPPRTDESRSEQARQAAEARVEQARQDADRARIEERVAQRLAERTAAARLHEQSRTEAAAHARAEAERAVTASVEARTEAPRVPRQEAPSEVAAAIASLPPELQAYIGRRPEGAIRAIDELGDALRTIELLSHAAAHGTAFASARGPRLMMPAGLGGLVAAIDRAHAIGAAPAPAPAAAQPMLAARAPRAPHLALRAPALGFMSAPTARPASALEATTAAAPAALAHVAWADRWLARFAGASQQSLDTLAAAGTFERATRMQALASAAPGSVFVAPVFDVERSEHPVVTSPMARPAAPALSIVPSPAPAPEAPGPRQLEHLPEAVRYDDDAETPDEVFEMIAAGATRARATAAQQQAAEAAPPPSGPTLVPPLSPIERYTAADAVAHATPGAPGAGFAAQLASSPFAPALRHVLPLPSAPSFDVRALFGDALSSTYLAGLLASPTAPVTTRLLPAWAAWTEQPAIGAGLEDTVAREAPSWDATYVAPDAIDADAASEPAREGARPDAATEAQLAAVTTQLTTLRSQLLAWNVEATPAGPAFVPVAEAATPSVVTRATASPMSTATARTMLEAMSLPMIGDAAAPETTDDGAAWTAPGMIAERAHAWSVAQERSSADLAFDFVPPELVLAARVYGLGPTEAAQAARLAIAGPGHLTAMAGAVDRTFVQAMAMEAERREHRLATVYPTSGGASPIAGDASGAATPESIAGAPVAPTTLGATGAAFGVDRKTPRGAFLWPSATVAALGLNAAAPDGEQAMSVAALELLAAQAVAELGTFTALADRADGADDVPVGAPDDLRADAARAATRTIAHGDAARGPSGEPAEADVLASAAALVPAARRGRFEALYLALGQSPATTSWSPAARAARALALAGRGEAGPVTARERAAFAWDVLPVVYADVVAAFGADRAALAFGEGAPTPAIAASDGTLPSERRARGALDRRTIGGREYVAADDIQVEGRPGLGALSARAGEALGSYVTPMTAPAQAGAPSGASAPRDREVGAVLRAPTAAQELVRTGQPAGRHGGGETEIPAWFEKAARKMLEDRSAPSDGISMAELTLVTAAPTAQIAASTRTAPAANPVAAGTNSQAQPAEAGASNIDVEKIANEIYRHILVMMDVARARNGESYL